jgi:hypothetical protein
VSRELLWLVVVDLRQAWLRPVLAALAIAIAILVVTLFVGQVGLPRSQVLAGYEPVPPRYRARILADRQANKE